MRKPTLITLFSGGGLFDRAAHDAGFESVLAVEMDEAICGSYAQNFGDKYIRCASVCDVDYRPFAGTDAVHASPVCTNASRANPKAGETETDRACGRAVARCINEVRPKVLTIENVESFKTFDSFAYIVSALALGGYIIECKVRDAADFGTAQHRERLILRAIRSDVSDRVPAMRQTHCGPKKTMESGGLFDDEPVGELLPWNGWYCACADLLHRCPETTLAKWQLDRLPANFTDSFLFDNLATIRDASVRNSKAPCITMTNANTGRRPAKMPCAVLVPGVPTNYAHDSVDAHDGSGNAPVVTASQPRHPMRAVLVEGDGSELMIDSGDSGGTITADHGPGKYRAVLVTQQYDSSTSNADRMPQVVQSGNPCPTVMSSPTSSSLRAVLVEGDAAGDRPPTVLQSDEPSFAMKCSGGGRVHRAVLSDCKVIALRPDGDECRIMARFQGVRDDHILPTNRTLASKIVGNGVAYEVAYAMMRPFVEVLQR